MSRVAFLLDQDFEDSEFRVPYDRLKAAGHELTVLGKHDGEELNGKRGKEHWRVDHLIDDARPEDYDALVIPGGYSPDKLRMHEKAVDFTRRMAAADKIVAAVCHAGSLLIEADLVRDRKLTSWPSIRTDLTNAGARWVNEEVVEDGPFITSRCPDDLEAFSNAIERRLAAGLSVPEAE